MSRRLWNGCGTQGDCRSAVGRKRMPRGYSARMPGYLECVDIDPRPWVGEPWYRRLVRGAIAGTVATAAMTVVQWPLSLTSGQDPPPVEITKRVSRVLPGGRRSRTAVARHATLAHFAFGGIAGALYGLIAPQRFREATGVAYAGLIWATTYLGWLPALDLHPPPERDDLGRQIGNAAGHVAYGIALGECMRVTQPR